MGAHFAGDTAPPKVVKSTSVVSWSGAMRYAATAVSMLFISIGETGKCDGCPLAGYWTVLRSNKAGNGSNTMD
jgi:hypothetical protein